MSHEKLKKFEAVADAIMQVLNQSGIGAVNHTQVARLSGVSRAWVYKYVGVKAEELIEFALDHFGKIFMGRGMIPQGATPEQIREVLVNNTWPIVDFLDQTPHVLGLYFRYLGSANAIGKKIHELETKQLEGLSKAIATGFKLTPKEARAVAEVMMAFRLGLSFRYSQTRMPNRFSQSELEKALQRVVKHAAHVSLQKK